jgi:hypothetical protein
VKIEYEGETYDYDPEDLSVKQAGKIERHIWKGNAEAVTAGARVQLAVLQQKNPSLDTGNLREAIEALAALAEKTGAGTLLEWEQVMLQARSDCIQALAWLLFHKGRDVPIADVDVKVIKLHAGLIAAMTAEAGAPDPTPAVPVAAAGNGKTTRSRVPSPTA